MSTIRAYADDGREVMKGKDAVYAATQVDPPERFMMETPDFLRVMREVYKFDVTRRTLQLYSSYQLRLLPLPVYRGKHKAHYLHPEHTERLAAVMSLIKNQFMPLNDVRKLMAVFPADYYWLLRSGLFTPRQLNEFVVIHGKGFTVRDFLYRRIFLALAKLRQGDKRQLERMGQQLTGGLMAEIDNFATWVDGSRMAEMSTAVMEETGEYHDALRDD